MSSFTTLTVLSLLAMASLSLALSSEASTSTAPPSPRGAATAAAFLSAINDARAEAGAPPVWWNATVARNAKAQVSWLRTAGGCDVAQLKRCPVPQLGPLTTYSSSDRRRTPADAVAMWVDERRWYDHGTNTCAAGKDCLSYTLVVKRAWRNVGCAVVACASGIALMACEYSSGTNRLADPRKPPY